MQVGGINMSQLLLFSLPVRKIDFFSKLKSFSQIPAAENFQFCSQCCKTFYGHNLPGNTKGRSITVLLTSCLTGLD
jgi:hypothetical protein